MRRARGRVRTALLDRRPRGGVGQYPGRGVPRHLGCVQGRGHPRALSAAGCAADGRGRARRAAVVLPLILAIAAPAFSGVAWRSAEHTSELQSLMRISYAVFCLKKTHSKNNGT